MKTHRTIALLVLTLLTLNFQLPTAFAQGTAFTYQGRLNDGANPANGSYDLTFALFDSANGGTQQGNILTNTAAAVSNGLFTVALDFGNQFPGTARWLEIGVRTNGGAAFATLIPRQPLTSTPYAVQAASAGSVSASNITGTLTPAQLPSSIVTNGAGGVNLSGTFQGNGLGLTNVPGTFPSQVVSNTTALAQANHDYVANSSTQVVFSLPVNANVGDVVQVSGVGSGGWQIQGSSGQLISGAASGAFLWTASGSAALWEAVASSADGSKLVAGAGAPGAPDRLYISPDGGGTWIPRPYTNVWYGVASSADGTKLAAVAYNGFIYTSSDSGTNWISRPYSNAWSWVAMSANGNNLVAVTYGDHAYRSSDGGVTWAPQGPVTNWWVVASSTDGSRFVAGVYGGQIYVSADGGVTWTPHGPVGNWSGVACSGDGTRLVASIYGGQIYVSVDGGNTWTPTGPTAGWWSVASSPDGLTLVAADISSNGQLYVSTDGGSTWVPQGIANQWQTLVSPANGTKLVAAASHGQIYTATPQVLAGARGSSVTLQYAGNGLWQATGLNAAQLNGTVPDTRLSSNVALRSGGNIFSGNQAITGGSLYLDNMAEIIAKNSSGIYEGFLWPRWSDNMSYLNYGSGGFKIRNNTNVTTMFMQPNGNVGIGTATPAHALQVGDVNVIGSQGMVRLASRTSNPSGTAGRNWDFGVPQAGDYAAGYNFIIHDLGLAYPAQFLVQVGTGNVGLGTTNPAATLDVNGSANVSGGLTVGGTGLNGNGAGLTNLNASQLAGASGPVPDAVLSTNVALRNSANTFSGNQTITGGNVGIGTTSPGRMLQLGGPANTEAMMRLASTASDNSGGRTWDIGVPKSDTIFSGKFYSFIIDDGSLAPSPDFLIQYGSGNLGLGTTNPLNRLQVNDPYLSVAGFGLMAASPTWGANIQINSTSGGAGLVLDDYSDGGANVSMLLIRNNNAAQTALNVLANGSTTVGGDLSIAGGINVDGGGLRITSADPGGWQKIGLNQTYGNVTMNVRQSPTFPIPFQVESPGGVTLVQVGQGGTLYVYSGVYAASFNQTSDRNAKENFQPVSPADVLTRVAALPIQEWNFKTDGGTRHIGPMAQDFYQAFGVGTDDKHIATVDADGVALAAIQGLNEKLEVTSQKSEVSLRELEAQNAALKSEVEDLRKAVQSLEQKLNRGGR